MNGVAKQSGGYGQYCPLALAAELLCRRWTVLVISRLLDGCTTFNEIHEGVPRISPSLLSTRLAELEHAGLLTRRKREGKNRHTYELTDAGRDLEDLVMQMAVWGQRWARDNELHDLDPGFLAWSMHQRIDVEAMPPGRTVLQFEFSGTPTDFRQFWLVAEGGKVDMCLRDPGYETNLYIRADLQRFVETWRGFRNLRDEIRSSRICLTGPRELRKAFPDWLLLSSLAPYERRKHGREATLQSSNSQHRL